MTIYYVTVGKKEYQVEINGKQYKINGELVQAAMVAMKERGKYLLDGVARKTEIYIESMGNSLYTLNANRRNVIAKVERSNIRRGSKVKKGSNGQPDGTHLGDRNQCARCPRRRGGDRAGAGGVGIDENANGNALSVRRRGGDSVNVQPKTQISKGELLIKIIPQ